MRSVPGIGVAKHSMQLLTSFVRHVYQRLVLRQMKVRSTTLFGCLFKTDGERKEQTNPYQVNDELIESTLAESVVLIGNKSIFFSFPATSNMT
jgi:hypothetical protein